MLWGACLSSRRQRIRVKMREGEGDREEDGEEHEEEDRKLGQDNVRRYRSKGKEGGKILWSQLTVQYTPMNSNFAVFQHLILSMFIAGENMNNRCPSACFLSLMQFYWEITGFWVVYNRGKQNLFLIWSSSYKHDMHVTL